MCSQYESYWDILHYYFSHYVFKPVYRRPTAYLDSDQAQQPHMASGCHTRQRRSARSQTPGSSCPLLWWQQQNSLQQKSLIFPDKMNPSAHPCWDQEIIRGGAGELADITHQALLSRAPSPSAQGPVRNRHTKPLLLHLRIHFGNISSGSGKKI